MSKLIEIRDICLFIGERAKQVRYILGYTSRFRVVYFFILLFIYMVRATPFFASATNYVSW